MTKGEIIESVLKELRSGRTVKRKRPSEDDEEEEAVVTHLEKLMQDAPPETNILTCADLSDLNVECCTQCHYFMFFYDRYVFSGKTQERRVRLVVLCPEEGRMGEDF
jgi:hypothetical protein